MIQTIKAIARRFLRETHAGATTFAAVGVAIMTVGGAALVIDQNLLIGHRDLLKRAVDAASVAATIELNRLPASLSDSEVQQHLLPVARKYAVLNVLGNLSDPDLSPDDIGVTLEIDRAARAVGATVQADIGQTLLSNLFLAYSGPGRMAAKSGVESVSNAVEVVLAIDASESMKYRLEGGQAWNHELSRMDIAKQAAADLVGILDPNEDNRVAVGVVPWHILVRLPEAAQAGWVANGWAKYPQSRHYDATYACRPDGNCTATDEDQTLPATFEDPWLGCVDEHRVSGAGDHASLPSVSNLLAHPSDTSFAQAIFPTLQGVAYECLQEPLPDNFQYQICYGEETVNVNRVYGRQAAQRNCTSFYTGDPMPDILPLTSDRAAIEAAIDSLVPIGNRTYSALGILWGQRLLSPSWRNVWGGDVHPVDPNASDNIGTRKAIVLLTDGEDNQCGLYDPTCATNDVGIERSVACTAAKTAGIEIFVVAAMHPDKVSGDLGAALRVCSSESEKPEGTYVFLENRDPETLSAAFADIARQLRTVRRTY